MENTEKAREERKGLGKLILTGSLVAGGLLGLFGLREIRDNGIERTNTRIEEQCRLASQYAEQGKTDEAVQAYNEAVRIYNETPAFFEDVISSHIISHFEDEIKNRLDTGTTQTIKPKGSIDYWQRFDDITHHPIKNCSDCYKTLKSGGWDSYNSM